MTDVSASIYALLDKEENTAASEELKKFEKESAERRGSGKEEAALQTLVTALFECGDVLFNPDEPSGPSLIINNEPGTEISLTPSQSRALKEVGIPSFADKGDRPSFDELLNVTTDKAHLLLLEVRDAGEEENFMEALRQIAPHLRSF